MVLMKQQVMPKLLGKAFVFLRRVRVRLEGDWGVEEAVLFETHLEPLCSKKYNLGGMGSYKTYWRGRLLVCQGTQDNTWGWRKLLKLSGLAEISEIFYWRWSQISFGMIRGTQMEFYMKKKNLPRVIYDAASSMDTKLASMSRDGDWRWKPERSYEFVAIQRKFCLVENGDKD